MKKDLSYYQKNAEEGYLTTPISVLRYIGMIERRVLLLQLIIITFLLFCFLSFVGGIYIGQNSKQDTIENRAKEIKTETLTQQQLEIVIFGEPQL